MLNGAKESPASGNDITPAASIVPVPVPLMPSIVIGVVPFSASEPTHPAGGLTAGHPNTTEIAPGLLTDAPALIIDHGTATAKVATAASTTNQRRRPRPAPRPTN
jgi:hypothetical protein